VPLRAPQVGRTGWIRKGSAAPSALWTKGDAGDFRRARVACSASGYDEAGEKDGGIDRSDVHQGFDHSHTKVIVPITPGSLCTTHPAGSSRPHSQAFRAAASFDSSCWGSRTPLAASYDLT
jgi:hypothetical protein